MTNQIFYCTFWKGVLQNNLIAKTRHEIEEHILEEHEEHSDIINELTFRPVRLVFLDEATDDQE